MTSPAKIDPRLPALVNRLLDLTRAGLLQWEKSVSSKDRPEPFSVNLTETTIRLRSGGGIGQRIEILDSHGILIQTIGSWNFSHEDHEVYSEYSEKLDTLYGLARRKALDVDNVIDNVIEELNAAEKPSS